MNKIPTARKLLEIKETFDKDYPNVSIGDAIEMSLELAKLHCIEQARVISEKAEIEKKNYLKTPMKAENYGQEVQSEHEGIYYGVDKDSVLNAYSLDLIK